LIQGRPVAAVEAAPVPGPPLGDEPGRREDGVRPPVRRRRPAEFGGRGPAPRRRGGDRLLALSSRPQGGWRIAECGPETVERDSGATPLKLCKYNCVRNLLVARVTIARALLGARRLFA